jgi:hypothetical protein
LVIPIIAGFFPIALVVRLIIIHRRTE